MDDLISDTKPFLYSLPDYLYFNGELIQFKPIRVLQLRSKSDMTMEKNLFLIISLPTSPGKSFPFINV